MKAIPTIPRPTTTIFFLEPAAMILNSGWKVAQQDVLELSSERAGSRVSARCSWVVSVTTLARAAKQVLCDHVTITKRTLCEYGRGMGGCSDVLDDDGHELAAVCLLYVSA